MEEAVEAEVGIEAEIGMVEATGKDGIDIGITTTIMAMEAAAGAEVMSMNDTNPLQGLEVAVRA